MNIVSQHGSPFDQIKNIDESGEEYWLGRQLQSLLGYKNWQRFELTIEKAKIACINVECDDSIHFIAASNLVERLQGGGSSQSDYKLSRYACYLIAMNGDPRKPEIAQAQNYFVVKTHEAELAPQMTSLIMQLQSQVQALQEEIASLKLSQGQVQYIREEIYQQGYLIASLQGARSDIPPGWHIDDWEELPPQDKKYFMHKWLKDNFTPLNKRTGRDFHREQRSEFLEAVGEISRSEQSRIVQAKKDLLNKFWAQEGGQA